MSWFDLGLVQQNQRLEIHPWGPLARGYVIPVEELPKVRRRNRIVKGAALVFGLGLGFWVIWSKSILALEFLILAAISEVLLTWFLVRKLPRTEKALGWDAGLLHLVKLIHPKLMIAVHWALKLLLVVSIFLVIRMPHMIEGYFLLVSLVGLQFAVVYLEHLQRSNKP